MDLELLDRLEDKVDEAVKAVNELRMENELLKGESHDLEKKIDGLTKELESSGESKATAEELSAKCTALEQKLQNVRGRIEGMVEKMKALEA